MKVKIMRILDTKDTDAELFGLKIQVTPRRDVFVADGKEIYSTPSREHALYKQFEVQTSLDLNQDTVKYLLENPDVKVAIF